MCLVSVLLSLVRAPGGETCDVKHCLHRLSEAMHQHQSMSVNLAAAEA